MTLRSSQTILTFSCVILQFIFLLSVCFDWEPFLMLAWKACWVIVLYVILVPIQIIESWLFRYLSVFILPWDPRNVLLYIAVCSTLIIEFLLHHPPELWSSFKRLPSGCWTYSMHSIQIFNWISLVQIPLTLLQKFKGRQPTLHLQIWKGDI